MKNYLKNKTALITGATSGIGKSVAKEFAKYGVNLVITGRRVKRLKKLKQKLKQKYNIKILAIKLDVTDKKEVKRKINKILKITDIDILVNNAGLALGLDDIDNGDIKDWDTMIDTNIKGLLYVSKYIISHLKNKKSGHIVNIGSIAGKMEYPKGNVYCATKSAVDSISRSMNIDLLQTNIKVTNIAPGALYSEFSKVRFKGDIEMAKGVYKGYKPLVPKDIAKIILFTINIPLHVNIQDILVMPTAQRNPYLINKNV